jgi:DNA-binding MarR family transcriptional regulator
MEDEPIIRRVDTSASELSTLTDDANIDLSMHHNIVGFMLRVAQVRIFQLYYKRERMARHGLTTGAYATLLAIRQNPGIRRGTLADVMATQRPNMTKLLNHLERSGYIRRKKGKQDKRTNGIFLTPAGRAKIDSMIADAMEHDEFTTSALKPAERRTLLQLLRKLADSLRTLEA